LQSLLRSGKTFLSRQHFARIVSFVL